MRIRRWILPPANGASEPGPLSAEVCGLPCIARLLRRRGFLTDEQATDFLRPRLRRLSDPFLLPAHARSC